MLLSGSLGFFQRLMMILLGLQKVCNGEVYVDLFEQEAYTCQGVIAPLVYQALVDEGILMLSPEHVATAIR